MLSVKQNASKKIAIQLNVINKEILAKVLSKKNSGTSSQLKILSEKY